MASAPCALRHPKRRSSVATDLLGGQCPIPARAAGSHVCVAIAIFAAFQLYEWYATGQIYARRYGPQHYISYAGDPVWFSFIATIYVSAVLLFGVGPHIMLINKTRRRR